MQSLFHLICSEDRFHMYFGMLHLIADEVIVGIYGMDVLYVLNNLFFLFLQHIMLHVL